MKVRFLKDIASTSWAYSAGDVTELHPYAARDFIASGTCEAVVEETETASLARSFETTTSRKPRTRKAR